jgi:hypothetical protein
MGRRVAEIGQDAVAHVVGDSAAIPRQRRAAALAIGVQDLSHVLRVETVAERR